MIKRSANKQGVVTFNIHFQHLQHPNKCSPNIDTTNTPLYQTDQSHASLLSYRSNPLTPLDYDDQHKALRHESRSISSDVDSSNMEDAQNSENASTRAFQHSHTNDENISKAVTEDFLTYEPIDFDDLQRVTGNERDDEDKSSAASTLSKSSKKITKAKAGHVYKESRFKEEARNKTKRQAWQPHEDEQVLELVSKHGQSWALIASMMEGRTGKQIRDRYLNKLKPDIKNEEWTREEDKLLITLFKTIGRKWSKIATHLPGRTEGQVKNRFYSHLQKRVLPTDQIGYVSASPEGEMSPASKVNEIVSRKAAPSERKFFKEVFHNNAGYKLDKNSLRQQMSNLEGNFDFQEHENLFEGGFQYPEMHQEMGEGRGHLRTTMDPTDVISYNETSNSDRKSLSPEKYPGKNNFVNKNYRMLPNNSQLNNPDFFTGAYQDNTGFTDLAHEFKARCNTENLTKRGFGGETSFQDRSPLQGVDQFINKEVYNDNKVSYNYKPITGGYGLLKERPTGEMYSRENMSNFASTTTQNPSNSYQYQRENANLF